MDMSRLSIGDHPPREINALIEIPMGGIPVKYEIDKDSGAMFVDRFLNTAMYYPVNYGFVPHTLSDDGDPLDIMVLSQAEVVPGVVIRSRPIGVLIMEDEAGLDEKILAVPIDKLNPFYTNMESFRDVRPTRLEQITHFFEHYKDLEKGKWVRVQRWGDADEAREIISKSIEAAKKAGN